MIHPDAIAQWLADNPGYWYRLAELVAGITKDEPDYVRQIGQAFLDYHDTWLDDDGQPSEWQEWHDFDPDC